MFSWFFTHLEKIGVACLAIVTFLLSNKNSKLSKENKELKTDLEDQENRIERQKELIDVAKNTKPTNLRGNVKRMRKKKL